jgi:hypothetical protein
MVKLTLDPSPPLVLHLLVSPVTDRGNVALPVGCLQQGLGLSRSAICLHGSLFEPASSIMMDLVLQTALPSL